MLTRAKVFSLTVVKKILCIAVMRRNLILVIILIVVILAIVAVYSGIRFDREELHFVHSTIINQYLYAWDEGIISHPVRVKTSVIQNPEALGLYLVGQEPADVVEAATVLAGIASSKKPEVRIVGSLIQARSGDSVVVVRRDAGITSPQDLSEKTIGIPGPAMTPIVLLRELLRQEYRIEYDQIHFIQKPLPILLTILEQGEVDAVIVFGIFAYQAALDPNLTILVDVNEEAREFLLGDYPVAAVLVSNKSTIDTRRQDLDQMLEAIQESFEYALSHQDEVASNVAPDLGLDVETYTQYAFRTQPASIRLTDGEREVILKILSIAYEQGLLERRVGEEIFW